MTAPWCRALLFLWLVAIGGGLTAVADEPPSNWEDPDAALADSLLAGEEPALISQFMIEQRLEAIADSLMTEGASQAVIEQHLLATRSRLEARLAELRADEDESGRLFYDLTNSPEAGINSNVTRVNRYGRLGSSVKVAGGGLITSGAGWSYDTFRRQDKTVENRNASGGYESGTQLPFTLGMLISTDWNEDITTNSAGSTNLNQRQLWRAGVNASKPKLETGPLRHNLVAGWFYNEQQAVNLEQRSDFSEGEFSGAVRSGTTLTEGLHVATRLYLIKRDGESSLADFQSPSSTTGDTLGIGAYYETGGLLGRVTLSQSSFDRRYLDYRRNSNGLIDTTNIPEGASRIVEELEAKDALNLLWDNNLQAGKVRLAARLEHSTDEQSYRFSGIGRRERSRDAMALQMNVPVGRDSFVVAYKYEWTWDDQQFAGATSSRGRQYRKKRELELNWFRKLFSRTTLSGRYRAELTQDIAENEFNENDRDRLTEEARLKLEARWPQRFSVSLLTEYQRVDDISIRASRSANNNARRTYEVAPGYRYSFSRKLELAQVFRMYIQYQDHAFAYLPEVQKDDTFNKRGNLATTVTLKPTSRLDLVVKHDYNERYNGTRTARDAAGNTFYRRDQIQTLNRIELGLTWTAINWTQSELLRFQAATYRTLDAVERFGTTTTLNERYSGQLWIGATLNRKWGPPGSPLSLNARVKRFLAYGPNVTDTSRDYWEADVKLSWTF
jgi:hypothetical protein